MLCLLLSWRLHLPTLKSCWDTRCARSHSNPKRRSRYQPYLHLADNINASKTGLWFCRGLRPRWGTPADNFNARRSFVGYFEYDKTTGGVRIIILGALYPRNTPGRGTTSSNSRRSTRGNRVLGPHLQTRGIHPTRGKLYSNFVGDYGRFRLR